MPAIATRTPHAAGTGFGGNGNGQYRPEFRQTLPVGTCRLGMWLGLAAVSMLFMSLTSAYVVRQGLDPDWNAIRMPRLLAINTLVLFASSISLERARRGRAVNQRTWLALTLLLGMLFLTGQAVAWRQLAGQGILLSTNPHSSFFYLLTGLHGLHLLGGLAGLTYLLLPADGTGWSGFTPGASRRQRWMEGTSLYWHFMDGLWIYVFVLLFGWR